MDHVHLLTGFDGRISRRPYWMGWVHVIALGIILGTISFAVAEFSDSPFSALRSFPFRLFHLIACLALLFPLAAIFVKRLHDRNKSGYHAVLPIGLLAVSDLIEFAGPGGMSRSDALVALIILAATLIVLAWYIVELGFFRGTLGPNRYGPDPLGKP